MTFLERATFGFGGAVYPLALASTTHQTLVQDADPGVHYFLDYLATVLQAHLGARWAEAVTSAGRIELATNIVTTRVPFDPGPYLTATQFSMPLLSMWRASAKFADQSIAYEKADTVIKVAWSLPPLSAGEAEQLMPFLTSVAAVITDRISEGSDDNYASGARWMELAGVQEAGVTSCVFGNFASPTNDLHFPTVLFDCYLVERRMPVAGAFEPLEGIDAAVPVDALDTSEIANEFAVPDDYSDGFSGGFE